MRTALMTAIILGAMATSAQARMPVQDHAELAGAEPSIVNVHHKPGHRGGPRNSFRGTDRFSDSRFSDNRVRGRSRSEERRFYGWERGNHYGWSGDRPPGWERNSGGRGRGMRF